MKRILKAPFLFLYYIFICYAGLIFPTTLIIIISIVCLIESFFKEADIPLFYKGRLGHLLGITVIIWGPFYGVYNYIKTGEIIFRWD